MLQKENSDIKKEAIKNDKKHEQEVSDLKKEKELLGANVCQLSSQNEALEQQVKHFEIKKLKCPFCDHKVENPGNMKNHVRANHMKDKYSQVENRYKDEANEPEFCKYPCFYCGKEITSMCVLEKHIPVCMEIQSFTAYQCDVCGAQCEDDGGLGRHRTKYHSLGTCPAEAETELFFCDICSLNYKTFAELKFHRIGCHLNEE